MEPRARNLRILSTNPTVYPPLPPTPVRPHSAHPAHFNSNSETTKPTVYSPAPPPLIKLHPAPSAIANANANSETQTTAQGLPHQCRSILLPSQMKRHSAILTQHLANLILSRTQEPRPLSNPGRLP